jgi:carbamoyl-phosphate synthase large subunit
MQTVLLTAIGSASAHAAHLSLTATGYRVLGCDIYPQTWNVTAADVAAFFTVPLASDADAYAAALLAAAREHSIDFIIPLTDVEVDALAPRKAAFAAQGVTLCCPDAPVAALCRDKLRMADTLRAAAIAEVIPTYTAATLPTDAPFPLMLKPRRGRSSQAQTVVRSAEELRWALALRDDYIIQPFIAGDIYTVDCARDTLGGMVALTRRELLRTVNGLGTTVEICPAHPLDAVCKAIMTHAGLVGVCNMEFIQSGGAYCFLEVNPRFSGGVGFSALAGYDFALAMLRCHAGEPLAPAPAFAPMTLAQRYEMRVTARR